MEYLNTVFVLLVLFQTKHFICDFPLQGVYMLRKMDKEHWEVPLLAHTAVHSIGTLLIVLGSLLYYDVHLLLLLQLGLGLACIDLVLHFLVDRIKASPNLGGKYKPTEPRFWINLGLDQLTHHIINYAFIYVIVLFLQQHS